MSRSKWVIAILALLPLCACDRAAPAGSANTTLQTATAPAQTGDAELEQLKAVPPVDACGWLTPDRLKAAYPELVFEVHQKLEPRMSGYVWDSRCTYWAGVGSVEFAKDVPTHTIEIFVATAVSEAKAQANLASRRESAASATGYQPQAALGADAFATTNTGVASLFFVRGHSGVQINISDLDTPTQEKVRKAVVLAQSL